VEAWSESPFAEWDVSRSHWERDGPTGTANGATGTTQLGRLGPRLGRLGPFPKGDWALHTGDSAHTGGDSRNRLAAPGAATRRGDYMGHRGKRRLAGGRATGDDSQARVARGPGPTRRSEWELATTVRAATSCAAPSYHPTFPYNP